MSPQTSPQPSSARRIEFSRADPGAVSQILDRQWLVTNGLGAYASGCIDGSVTWKYHGLLIAALPGPFGRTVMLNHLAETVRLVDGRAVPFGGGNLANIPLVEFGLENHLPYWRYEVGGVVLEKRLLMPYLQNTVHIRYTLRRGEDCRLELRPSVNFRRFESDLGNADGNDYRLSLHNRWMEIHGKDFPPLRMLVASAGSDFVADGGTTRPIHFRRDAERGYAADGCLWSPGYFSAPLPSGGDITLIASTEPWHIIAALDPLEAWTVENERRSRLQRISAPAAHEGFGAALVLAADQFVISPAGRVVDAARARAAGDELRSVIAGYHWFGDWGRDTMISLEGLTLVTGRKEEAAWILRTFARYVKDGLIPNLFPEGANEGLYHTADATLWFFHAINRYLQATGDRETVRGLLPVLRAIAEAHLRGTRFGIGADPSDGLLRQGAEGYQLTWMDAKVGDWVVTPRRGKAVEINALWFNALTLLSGWLAEAGDPAGAAVVAGHARQAEASFNARFWNPERACLFDVVDVPGGGNDASVRPNQVIAMSLDHPVLARERWQPVLAEVERVLLTPFGLRSLSPDNPEYKPQYSGDLRARDAAYHQGTVWAWLIGPFVDAWLRLHPREGTRAREFLRAFEHHTDEGCVGSIAEIFDAEPPYTPRGCVAQAWSVAEVLRAWVRTSESATR